MSRTAAELQFAADEPAADGHFPGNPIIPGAVLLREIARLLSDADATICSEIPSAKFLHPVRPGDRLTVNWQMRSTGETDFTGDVGTRRVVSGMMRMRAR